MSEQEYVLILKLAMLQSAKPDDPGYAMLQGDGSDGTGERPQCWCSWEIRGRCFMMPVSTFI